MSDPSTILASLDRFIETFKMERGVEIGRRVATGKHGAAIVKVAENQEFGQFGHCGHSELDKCADDEHDPDFGDTSDVVVAPKIVFSNGKNGNSGQTQEDCGFDRGHSENRIGHSGQSQQAFVSTASLNTTADRANKEITFPEAESESGYWSGFYEERAAVREFEGGYSRDEAERLSWCEVEGRWHMTHCGTAVPGVCAGCGQPITDDAVISLIDGNKVHDRRDHGCLIRFGKHWRGAARASLIALGLKPPVGLQ
jgi:hypothetical protein